MMTGTTTTWDRAEQPILVTWTEPGTPANANEPLLGSVAAGWFTSTREDPAFLVAMAVRLGVIGAVDGSGVPAELRQALLASANGGDRASLACLDWLDRTLLRQITGDGR